MQRYKGLNRIDSTEEKKKERIASAATRSFSLYQLIGYNRSISLCRERDT